MYMNVTNDAFLAITMVQQMTDLSDAATDKEKVPIITKAVFTLLKNNANNRSQTTKIGIERQAYWPTRAENICNT
jgi:hypothetical protein